MTSSPDGLEEARRLHARAVAANSAGRPADAAGDLQAALEHVEAAGDEDGGPHLAVRVLLTMAMTVFEQSGLDAATEVLDRTAEAARELDDPELTALCHSQRAMMLGQSGRMAAALEELDAAVARLASLAPRDQFVIVSNRSVAHSLLGSLDMAAEDAARARRVAVDHGLEREQHKALHNEGWVAYLAGDLPRALELLGRADALDADVSGAVTRLDHGRVLLEAGLIREAVSMLTTAAAVGVEREQGHVVAEVEYELARGHALLGDADQAEALAGSAAERFRRRSAVGWAARAELLLAQLAATVGADHETLATAQRLIDQARAEGDSPLGLDAHLLAAQACVDLGQPGHGAEHLAAAEELAQRMGGVGSLTTRLQLHLLTAVTSVARSDDETARGILDRAAAELARSQVLSASLDLRTAIATHGTRLAALDLDLAVRRGAEAVLGTTERWRAATARLPRVRPPSSPALAGHLADLRRVREELRTEADAQRRAAMLGQLERLEEQVQVRARERHEARGVTEPVLAPVSPAEVVTRLEDAGADLVSLATHRGQLLGVAVVDGRVQTVDLGPERAVAETARRVRADLQAAAAHELGPMHMAVWSSLRAGLAELDERLIQPFGLTADRLVVVPHRGTAAMPWSMLPSLHQRPVVVAPSVTVWARGTAGPRPSRGTPDVRVIAGPDLGLADEEARQVASLWSGAEVRGAAASSAGFLRTALADADVVHIAAHGTHHQQSPLFASVRLADGPLFVHDLELSGVGAAHVVLSSCDVGRSTVRPGEEPLGLAAGMLALGARSVVAAVCRVPDQVAAPTMARYHAALAAGRPSDIALAEATADGPELSRAFLVTGSAWQVR